MTQNLDFDLPTTPVGNVTIAAENTDLTADQTGLTVIKYTNATGVEKWKNPDNGGNAVLQYYNPGLYVYTQPTEGNICNDVTNFDNCTSYGWKEYAPGDDEHYLIGNYYSWPAVTAGTGVGVTGGIAPGSICPANWKLPYTGKTLWDASGSFPYLLEKGYGFEFNSNGIFEDFTNKTDRNITSAPFYFLLSGYVSGFSAVITHAGLMGGLWSSFIYSDSNAYFFAFDNLNITLFDNNSRSFGFPIRCVVI